MPQFVECSVDVVLNWAMARRKNIAIPNTLSEADVVVYGVIAIAKKPYLIYRFSRQFQAFFC
ncbi:MAG: hypothetical protein GXP14_13515 [Gammaproteobacteria bacterium]|nr:hypothetical protein [Gammaproteobacteria bacterium]